MMASISPPGWILSRKGMNATGGVAELEREAAHAPIITTREQHHRPGDQEIGE